MEIPREDLERFMFFEQAREQALADLKRNPRDAETLTKLGRTLVELAQFVQGQESNAMLDDAVVKLDEAVKVDSKRGDTLWWLGNAHTTRGFQTPDPAQAGTLFEKAQDCFQKAIELEPSNDAYRKSLEVALKGPELHQEVQKQMALQQAVAAAVQPSQQGLARGGKKKRNNEYLYDAAGWVILGVAVVAWLSLISARANAVSPTS